MKAIKFLLLIVYLPIVSIAQTSTEIENRSISFYDESDPFKSATFSLNTAQLNDGFKLFEAQAGQLRVGDDLGNSTIDRAGIFVQEQAVLPARNNYFGVSDLNFTTIFSSNSDQWSMTVVNQEGDRTAFSIIENNTTDAPLVTSTNPILIKPHDQFQLSNDIILKGLVGINTESPSDGLHIKQKNDDFTISDNGAFKLERQANTDNWSIVADNFGDLSFLRNGVCIGYISNMTQMFSPCGLILANKTSKAMSPVLDKIINTPLEIQKYNKSESRLTYSLNTQAVEKYFPELILTSNRGDLVNKAELSVIAIKAIQEQQQIINEITEENALLRQNLESLIERLNKLENTIHSKK